MARKAIVDKCKKRQARAARQRAAGQKVTNSTKLYNRCERCGDKGSYFRDFGLCRICLRELALNGKIMGLKKSSW